MRRRLEGLGSLFLPELPFVEEPTAADASVQSHSHLRLFEKPSDFLWRRSAPDSVVFIPNTRPVPGRRESRVHCRDTACREDLIHIYIYIYIYIVLALRIPTHQWTSHSQFILSAEMNKFSTFLQQHLLSKPARNRWPAGNPVFNVLPSRNTFDRWLVQTIKGFGRFTTSWMCCRSLLPYIKPKA